jgi:hypothetical protein
VFVTVSDECSAILHATEVLNTRKGFAARDLAKRVLAIVFQRIESSVAVEKGEEGTSPLTSMSRLVESYVR